MSAMSALRHRLPQSTEQEGLENATYSAEAKKATNVVLKHINLITQACIEHGGLLYLQQENQKAIAHLNQAKLGFYIDDIDGFQLSNAVVRYISHITQTSRLRASSQTLSGLIEELESSIEFYYLAQKHGGHDLAFYENDLQERVINIISELNGITLHFSYQVYNTLNIIEDLDIKIRENEKALETINRLNQVFSHLTVNKLSTWARQDAFLQALLLKLMKSAIDRGITELINSGHQLRQNLAKLQQDKQQQKLNHLIDGFYQHYLQHPTFKPDSSLLSQQADCFNLANDLALTSYPDLDNPVNDEFIGDIATSLSERIRQYHDPNLSNEPQSDSNIEDVTDSDALQFEQSPLYIALLQFFEALISEEGYPSLSAVDAWEFLFEGSLDNGNLASDPDNADENQPAELAELDEVSIEDWLLNVASYYYMHKDQFQPPLSIHIEEEAVENYSGNHIVRDIVIKRSSF